MSFDKRMAKWIKEVWGSNPGLLRKRAYYDSNISYSGRALLQMCIWLKKTPDQLPTRRIV